MSRLLALLLVGIPALCALDDSAEIPANAEQAITRALDHLAGTQRPDGTWPGSPANQSSGPIGLCVLAFLAAGEVPGYGRHGVVVARAVDQLLEQAQPDGLLYRDGGYGAPMYNHGLATLALAEVWGMTRDDRLLPVLKKAVGIIVQSQNPRGGWKYQPRQGGADLSVSVTQLVALRACRDGGIAVPKATIDKGMDYVRSLQAPKARGGEGGFGYAGPGSTYGMTGAGMLALQVVGDYRSALIQEAAECALQFEPLGAKPIEDWPFYGRYYVAQGLYQTQSLGDWGRAAWARYYPAMVDWLLSKQGADATWDQAHGYSWTAMAVLALAIPHRCLPIYQR